MCFMSYRQQSLVSAQVHVLHRWYSIGVEGRWEEAEIKMICNEARGKSVNYGKSLEGGTC